MSDTNQTWLEALQTATQTLAARMLGMDRFDIVSKTPSMSGNLYGAYLPILMESATMYVGVLAERKSAETIARKFLQAEDGSPVSDSDITSAFGEISNMLGGGVQRRIESAKAAGRLGLPVLVHGKVKEGANVGQLGVEVQLSSEVAIKLMVLKGPGAQYTVKKKA